MPMTAYTKVFPSHDLLFILSLMVQSDSSRRLRGLGGGMFTLWGGLIQPKEHQSRTWNGYAHFPFLAMVI